MFSPLKIYHIFISHSWHYKAHYETVKSWIESSNISASNYSIPEDKAYPTLSKFALQNEITQQIERASVVIVIAGGYIPYSEWLEYEIKEAIRLNKPILAVRPRGNETWPSILSKASNIEYVNWNSNSVITTLKKLL